MLKLSKTMFKSYIRCERYAALDTLKQQQDDAVVAFSENATIEDLMSYEVQKKKQDLLNEMKTHIKESLDNDEEDEEDSEKDAPIFMDDFNKLELLTAKKLSEIFGGTVIASEDTFNQKRFNYSYKDHDLYCFLDAYQEDSDTIRICEVKATTSSKFSKVIFNNDKTSTKDKVFEEVNNIYYLKEALEGPMNESYNEKINGFKDRMSDIGSYLYDLAYQMFVVKNQGLKKKVKYYLSILNHTYVYDGKKDSLGNEVYDSDIMTIFDVTDLVLSLYDTIKNDIDIVISRMERLDASEIKLGKHCQLSEPSKMCPFAGVCYKHIPKDYSLFNYVLRQHGYYDEHDKKHDFFDLINNGYIHALDLDERFFVSSKYKQAKRIQKNIIQREVISKYLESKDETPFVRKDEMREIINHLKYPLYHLDFESLPSPLPKHKGEKPYTQSLFQFSVHIESKPGVCDYSQDHIGFLATSHKDERLALVQKLVETIKDDGGHIIVWNQTFEKARLEELAELFPMYADVIHKMISRLYDLMKLFNGDNTFHDDQMFNFYHHKMKNSFSIKKVLPVFSKRSHEDLEVQNGGMAMKTFKKFKDYDPETLTKKYDALIKYCQLDTFAMVEILDGARKLV